MMNRKIITIRLLAFVVLVGALSLLLHPVLVLGQDATIPTRTPTPGSGGGGGGGGGGGQQPTNTPQPEQPGPTNTPTATATAESSPTATATGLFDGDSFPTAEPCGEPPTITTLSRVNVYRGPGSDYPLAAMLLEGQVFPIVGRASDAEWWLIQIDSSGAQAWISDKAGIVQGYTGNVEEVNSPPINGETPTPGAPWNPTPVPFCTLTPTPTATATSTATATLTPASQSSTDNAGDSASTDGSTAEVVTDTSSVNAITDNANKIATSESITDGSASDQSANDASKTEIVAISEDVATAVPLETNQNSSSSLTSLLPVIGLVLIVGAVFIALFLRRAG